MSSSSFITYSSVKRIYQCFSDCALSQYPHFGIYAKSIKFLTFPLIADTLKSLMHNAAYQSNAALHNPKQVIVQACLSLRDTSLFRQSNPAYIQLSRLLDNQNDKTQHKIHRYIEYSPSNSYFDIPFFRRNIFYRSNILVSNLSCRNLIQKLTLFFWFPFKSIRINSRSVSAKSSACHQSRQQLLTLAFSYKTGLAPLEYKALLLFIIIFPTLLLEDFNLLNNHIKQSCHRFNKGDYLITANGIQGCEVLTLASQAVGFRVHIVQHGFGYLDVIDHLDIRYLVESNFADSFSSFTDKNSIPSFKLSYTRNILLRKRKWISVLPQPFSLYPGIELITNDGQEFFCYQSSMQAILQLLMSKYLENQINVRVPRSSSIVDYNTPLELYKSSKMSLCQTLNHSKIVIIVGVSTVLYESLLSSTPTIWVVSSEVLRILHPRLKQLASIMRMHSMLFDSAHIDDLTSTLEVNLELLSRYHSIHRNFVSLFLNTYSNKKFIQRMQGMTL